MDIWGFVIGGAIGLVVVMIIVFIAIECCEEKIEELENRIKFQDKSISELEKTAGKYIELYRLISIECYNLTSDVKELKNNKKDKTEEDIINEELLKYSKECAKAVEDRLNKKGDSK